MRARAVDAAGVADVDLGGRNVLVTGATSGIGRETALALGSLGATVLVHGRDEAAGERVVGELRRVGAEAASFLPADFASLASVEDLAAAVESRVDGLDVLVNNAGGHFRRGRLTDAGVERTFAVNHLAPFLLTARLAPILADDGRVVTVASTVHGRYDGDFSEVGSVADYDGLDAYARSKLANVLFTLELAERLDGPTATCCPPGFVPGSRLWRNASLPVRLVVSALAALPDPITRRVADTPATAAATGTYLAAAPEAADWNGVYVSDCEPTDPATQARDDDLRERLWDLSVELSGLDGDDIPARERGR